MSNGNGIERVGVDGISQVRKETKFCDGENGMAECPQTGDHGSYKLKTTEFAKLRDEERKVADASERH